jgi:hypothetical protein
MSQTLLFEFLNNQCLLGRSPIHTFLFTLRPVPPNRDDDYPAQFYLTSNLGECVRRIFTKASTTVTAATVGVVEAIVTTITYATTWSQQALANFAMAKMAASGQ